MTNKRIISHHNLSDMVATGTMTEIQALTALSRMRVQADRDGLGVTRLIVGGKVQQQTIWERT